MQVSHGVLDRTFQKSIPQEVMTVHNVLDQYAVTNPYGLFRRYVSCLIFLVYHKWIRGYRSDNPPHLTPMVFRSLIFLFHKRSLFFKCLQVHILA